MKAPHLLEYRALGFLDALKAGQSVSPADPFTANFAGWPGPAHKAARMLAAHANAARGRDVLWLIGVRRHETGRLVTSGTTLSHFDAWFHGILPFFDGLAPNIRAFELPAGPVKSSSSKPVIALLIETQRAPFVVRGSRKGVASEVPWWDAESRVMRSADRQDLIRLLVPLQDLPQVEVLEAELTFYKNLHASGTSKIAHRWTLDGSLYVIPKHETHTIIPLHRCRAALHIPGTGFSASAQDLTLTADKQSPAVRITESAALIEGLGRLFVYCSGSTAATEIAWQSPLNVTFDLLPAGAERTVVAAAQLRPSATAESNQAGRWKL